MSGGRTVVFGYAAMGCLGFEALERGGFEISAVITHRDDPGETTWWPSLAELAESRGVPVHYSAGVGDPELDAIVKSYQPDFLFSFYFRYLISERVLGMASRGALNLHGSLLPKLRGCAPLNWALVEGETETGVSLHHMVRRADAGALVDQIPVAIDTIDTAYTLFWKLADAAEILLNRCLPAVLDGTATATDLDLSAGSYFGRRRPKDGLVDWSWDAGRIYNLVRAVTLPYPGAFTELDGEKLLVWWALPVEGSVGPGAAAGTILSIDAEGIVVAAGQGSVRLITVQAGGHPILPAAVYANFIELRTGQRLGAQQKATQ